MGERDGYNPDRREFVKDFGKTFALVFLGGALPQMGLRAAEEYSKTNYEDEKKGLSPEKIAELDAAMDESLQSYSKMESDLQEMVAELEKAGATSDQISESKQRYAEYIADRYRAKVLEIAAKIENTK